MLVLLFVSYLNALQVKFERFTLWFEQAFSCICSISARYSQNHRFWLWTKFEIGIRYGLLIYVGFRYTKIIVLDGDT